MRWIIDRIEEGWAVCYTDDDRNIRIDMPVQDLPEGVLEGDHLIVTFEIDREKTKKEKEYAEELLRELSQSQNPKQRKFKL